MVKKIKDIQKNSKEIIRLEFSEYKGNNLFNIRVWYKSGEDDEYKPSPKGIAFNPDLLEELKNAITDAAKIYKEENK